MRKFDPEILIDLNQAITGNSVLLNNSTSSCISSMDYYETVEEKISSIIRSIIKNHYFQDGNKRLAFAVFNILTEANGITIKNKNWSEIFLDIASHNYNVIQISKMLF